MRINVLPLAAAAVAVLLAGLAAPAVACVGGPVTVAKDYVKPARPVSETAFDQDGILQHFDSLPIIDDFRPNDKSTYACIDSRSEDGILGTPGGDFAELAGAIQAYYNLTGVSAVNTSDIRAILTAFMDQVVTKDRPFYYHTSDEKLHKVFHHLEGEKGVKPAPSVLPESMPTDAKLRDAWLDALSMGQFQGCGHVRLMISKPSEYGLKTNDIPKDLVKEFYRYWWGTPKDSEERSKVKFSILQGPLDGKGIAIVDTKGACKGQSPAVPPSHGGSQVFIYNAKSVEEFRKNVITPFFVKYAKSHGKTLDETKFFNKLQSVQAQHLAATLKYLEPANALPIWPVTVEVKDS